MKRFHKIFSKFALLAVFIQLLSVGLLYAPKAYADEISNIKINEFFVNPIGSEIGSEFIELSNTSNATVDLKDWTIKIDDISNSTFDSFDITLSHTLFFQNSLISLSRAELTPIASSSEFSLDNPSSGNQYKISVFDNVSSLKDSVTYSNVSLNDVISVASEGSSNALNLSGSWDIGNPPTPGYLNDFNGLPTVAQSVSDLRSNDRADNKIELSWHNGSNISDLAGYIIELQDSQNNWNVIDILDISFGENSEFTWVSQNSYNPATYKIRIFAYDYSNNQSLDSSEIEIIIPEYNNVTTIYQKFADNVEIKSTLNAGQIKLIKIDNPEKNPNEDGVINIFGNYWKIEAENENALFADGNQIEIKILFSTSDIQGIDTSKILGLFYFKDGKWQAFEDTGIVLPGGDEVGYVWAKTNHFTEITPMADIAGPEIKSLTDNSQKDRPFLTYTYNVDDKAGSGISKVELIVDGEIKATNNYSDIPQAKTDTISYRVSQNKTYTIILRAYDAVGNVTESSPVQTEIDVPIPSAPTSLKIERIDGKYLLSWDDGRGAWVDYYSIYFSTDAVNYSLLGKTNQMSYTISNLLEGKIYYFKVLANSIGGDSESSNVAYIAVAGPPAAPVAEILTTPVAQAAPSPAVTDTEEEDIVPPPASPVEEEAKTDEEKDNTRIIITIIVILLAAGAGIGGYYGYLWWQERIAPENTQVNETKKPQAKKSSNPKTTKKPTKRSSSRW